ncbi:protein-glutamate O-methyltransferase CheR [Telmatospirillum sp.]|uniref:CheR family methyltransferase n=1 Tax=Telmatospirillum sp. TaxID=2079197 RepID=UPI00284C821D|nr:protein-glutamate O-methyltransferase CheR [Telmatospirillum sp.]MDR3440922.1 protein-glutamate O-methyltransferase CheR [Telmatospirillum sp.]
MRDAEIQEIEISLFLEALRLRHGYDFRNYARASLKRRILGLAQSEGCVTVDALIPRLLRDQGFLPRLLARLSVPVTELFRDPAVFLVLRDEVLPMLGSYPRIVFWQAGCATGEECYSLGILLKEMGLLQKSQIYATDINDAALATAEEGIYPTRAIAECEASYRKAGGIGVISEYFHSAYDYAKITDEIRSHIVFAHHNLVTDGVFCEVHMVLCRNVLIYFDRNLQNRVAWLFHDSLVRGGFLCLGTRETLQFAEVANQFKTVHRDCRIFKKTGATP